jgi:hypothetical protein
MYAIVLAKNDMDGLPAQLRLPPAIAARVGEAKLLGGPRLQVDADGSITFPQAVRQSSLNGLAWAIKLDARG